MTDVKISPNAAPIHVEGNIGGGSGGAFKVTITSSTDPNTQEWVYTADKTFAEISEAIESAQYIYAVQSWNEEECNFIPLRGFVAEQYILFSICDVYGDEDGMRLRYQSISINPDESVGVDYSSKSWNSI